MQGPSGHTVWPQPEEEERRLLGTWWLEPPRRDGDRHGSARQGDCTGLRGSHPLFILHFSL